MRARNSADDHIRSKTPKAVYRTAVTIYIVVLVAVCLAAFWPVYRGVDFVVMGVGALVAGTAVALLSLVLRWNSALTALVAVVVFVALGVPLAVPEETVWLVIPTWQGLLDLLSSVALGWRQLATIAVPVGAYQALLTPAYVLAFFGTVLALTLALRSRMPELALVPPLTIFVTAILLGPDTSATPLVLTVTIAVLSIVWLVWMRRRRRMSRLIALASEHADGVRRSERSLAATRSVAVAAAALACAVAASTLLAAGLPAATARTVVRTAVTPPFDPRDYPSPLSGFRSYLQPDASDSAMFTATGLGDVRRLSIATLDTYDGVVYSVGAQPGDSGAFARVPDTLGAGQASARAQTATITVGQLSGPWLPTFGGLRHIEFTGSGSTALREGFYYNAVTDGMVDVATLHAGDTYTLSAVPATTKTLRQLADASPGRAQQPTLVNLPSRLHDTVTRYEGDATKPGAQLTAVLQHLADAGYISHGLAGEPKSLSGHGADRIDQLLTDSPMVGDAEQYAVTAALMARQVGFPARVVLGFEVPQNASDSGVTFTGADVTAWIQVQTAQDGWVDVDPNPQVRPIPAKTPDEPKQISRPQSAVEPPKDSVDRDQNPPPQSHADQQRDNALPEWLQVLFAVLTVLGWTLLIAALAISPFLAVIAAKWRRRRSRRSRRVLPRGRIAGAWREFSDAALDHGYTPPTAATRAEAAKVVGGPRPLLLASVADRSAFGIADPTETDADQVWRAVDELRRDLDARTTKWGRLRARISLRSLGGYRGGERPKGGASR